MNARVERGLNLWPVQDWFTRICKAKWAFALRIRTMPSNQWAYLACTWRPSKIVDRTVNVQPHLSIGRPFLEWDGTLTAFCFSIFGRYWLDVPFANDCSAYANQYAAFCR